VRYRVRRHIPPKKWLRDAAVVENGKLDFRIAPQCPVPVKQSCQIAGGIGEDILRPYIHVQKRGRHLAVKALDMPVQQTAHEVGFLCAVAVAANNVIKQTIPHHNKGRYPLRLGVHRLVIIYEWTAILSETDIAIGMMVQRMDHFETFSNFAEQSFQPSAWQPWLAGKR